VRVRKQKGEKVGEKVYSPVDLTENISSEGQEKGGLTIYNWGGGDVGEYK